MVHQYLVLCGGHSVDNQRPFRDRLKRRRVSRVVGRGGVRQFGCPRLSILLSQLASGAL